MFLLLATGARADPASDKLLADARAAAARSPEDQRAWRAVGAASCMKKDRNAVVEAIGHLKSDADLKMVQRVCETNGLHVDRSPEVTFVEPGWSERIASRDPEAQLNSAMDAYVNGRYYEAIALVLKALARDSRNAKGWRIVGGAACYLRDGEVAALAARTLERMDDQFVRYICVRNEIKLPPLVEPPVPATKKEVAELAARFPEPRYVAPLLPP
jgi:hypothetical protein